MIQLISNIPTMFILSFNIFCFIIVLTLLIKYHKIYINENTFKNLYREKFKVDDADMPSIRTDYKVTYLYDHAIEQYDEYSEDDLMKDYILENINLVAYERRYNVMDSIIFGLITSAIFTLVQEVYQYIVSINNPEVSYDVNVIIWLPNIIVSIAAFIAYLSYKLMKKIEFTKIIIMAIERKLSK